MKTAHKGHRCYCLEKDNIEHFTNKSIIKRDGFTFDFNNETLGNVTATNIQLKVYKIIFSDWEYDRSIRYNTFISKILYVLFVFEKRDSEYNINNTNIINNGICRIRKDHTEGKHQYQLRERQH
jgi:hypothetical protein